MGARRRRVTPCTTGSSHRLGAVGCPMVRHPKLMLDGCHPTRTFLRQDQLTVISDLVGRLGFD